MKPITRLFDFAYYQLETHNLDAALVSKKDGEWIKTSSKEYINKAAEKKYIWTAILSNDDQNSYGWFKNN